MKIIFIYQYFGTPKAVGVPEYMRSPKDGLRKAMRLLLFTSPYYKSDIKASKLIENQTVGDTNLVVINTADNNKHGTLRRAWNATRFAVLSIYKGLSIEADLIIASSGPITVGLPGMFISRMKRIPLVFEVRDLWPLGAIELKKIRNPLLIKISKWFERTCYRNSSLVVACSDGMEAGVKTVVPTKRTLCIPNAANLELFSHSQEYPEDVPEHIKGKKWFIYTGSLGLMDECDQIVRSFDHLEQLEEDIAIVFIGDGAERRSLEREAKQTAFRSYHFTGLMPKTDVVKWYNHAYASLITFRNVPVLQTVSPNKLFDSLAAGVPVIQSTHGWIKSTLDEHEAGLSVHPDDPQSLSAAIGQLAKDQTLRDQMAQNARKLAEQKFNMDLLADEYLTAIGSLVKT